MDLSRIELNEEFKRALNLMEKTNNHVFVTGRAGTGKSTLLQYVRDTSKKKIAVLAPTGVAAVNIQGQTIHSFFGFRPDITPQTVIKYKGIDSELYKAIDTIVIDEISMVRADLLDCIDKFLKLNGRSANQPFGGVQMIFFGDLYQLSPVVSGKEKEIFRNYYNSQYFFDAKVFRDFDMEFVELEKIYRQQDRKFIDILNAIRNNSVTEEMLMEINGKVNPWFNPDHDEFYVHLTTTNEMAADINQLELSKLSGRSFQFEGRIKGDFGRDHLPADIVLKTKVGSQIMMVNNDSAGRWINGTVGRISDIRQGEDGVSIEVELANGITADVKPYTWKIVHLKYNKRTTSLDSEHIGSFTQYPLKLAWAVTIHKSQGKTFNKVIIDIGKGTFSHGQIYVALSRCTSLDGIILKRPIGKKHIFMDWRVVQFLTKYQYKLSEKRLSLDKKIKMIECSIKNKRKLEIVYLKANDEKSKRLILPIHVGEMEYLGKKYVGVEGYCFSRNDNRKFRIDRILEVKEAELQS